jgi:hypothetical protein
MRYFDIVVLDGTLIDHDSFLHADTHFKSVQLKRILDLFNEGRVVDGDIFVFGNAWNYIAIPLSYFRDEYGVEIKLVGFWGNSMFNPHSPMHNRFLRKHRTTAKFFERSLYESYDLNCFFDGLQYNKFQTFFGEKFARTSKSEITGYPFGYLKDVLKAKGILTTMSVDGQSGLQVMHTLRKAIYLTTFGERVGNIVIGGIIFQASCDDDPFNPNPGILKFYEWYERNRISTTGLPVSITVTAGLVLDGFLTNMRFGVEDASLGIVQFMMSFIYPPRIVDLLLILQFHL